MYDYEDRISATRGYFHTTDGDAWTDFCREFKLNVRENTKNEVCSHCRGEGSVALHGLVVSEEAQADLDFMEDYMAGRYDTRCEECHGNRVVRTPNIDELSAELQKEWRKWLREIHECNAESLSEMRMGC